MREADHRFSLPVKKFDEITGKIGSYQEKCVFSHGAVDSLITHKPRRPAIRKELRNIGKDALKEDKVNTIIEWMNWFLLYKLAQD